MSYVETLHAERKARLARIAQASIEAPLRKPQIIAEPQPASAKKIIAPAIIPDPVLGYVPTIFDIQRVVCAHFGVTRIDLLAQRRKAFIVRARQVACYLAHELTPKSLPEIGRYMGGRDHTTVYHAVQKIEAVRHTDRQLQASVEMLLHALGGNKSERRPRRLLSEEAVREIRTSIKTDVEIGLQYGIHACTAFQVRTGKTWRHVK